MLALWWPRCANDVRIAVTPDEQPLCYHPLPSLHQLPPLHFLPVSNSTPASFSLSFTAHLIFKPCILFNSRPIHPRTFLAHCLSFSTCFLFLFCIPSLHASPSSLSYVVTSLLTACGLFYSKQWTSCAFLLLNIITFPTIMSLILFILF